MVQHQDGDADGQIAMVAEAISKWASGQPKWQPLASDASLLGDLDFAPEDSAVRRAKEQLVEEGILGMDEDGYHFVAIEG
jgi:hypothetical protein